MRIKCEIDEHNSYEVLFPNEYWDAQVEDGTTQTVNNYDQENRLASVFVDEPETYVYTCDADGLRRTVLESGGPRNVTMVWDGTDYLGEVES